MMTFSTKLIGSTLGLAAAVIASGGMVVPPTAYADANCTVPGAQLEIHQATGYDVSVDANGASLGPAVLVSTPGTTSQGNITGGINGRTIDFIITWYGTKANVHFTGTVGDDGIAHGTSTQSQNGAPVNLAAGPWDSVTQLTCA